MPVSGVGSSGVNYPVTPPNSGATAAYSYILLAQLAAIASALNTKAGGGPGDTSVGK